MRARNIKPGFFKNENLAECTPMARILFAGLWCCADREGRLEDRPKRIRAEVFPYDDCDCELLLSELSSNGFITRYTIGEDKYIQIDNFSTHQNPHCKERESFIPAPDKHGANPVQTPGEHENRPADSLIPDSLIPIQILLSKGEYEVTPEMILEYQDTYPDIDVIAELKKCRQWNKNNEKKRKTAKGMPKHINLWLSRAGGNSGDNRSGTSKAGGTAQGDGADYPTDETY